MGDNIFYVGEHGAKPMPAFARYLTVIKSLQTRVSKPLEAVHSRRHRRR